MRISIIGSGVADDSVYDLAYEVGRLVAERGHEVVCGGRGGVMEAACAGASAAGGRTIGISPARTRPRPTSTLTYRSSRGWATRGTCSSC